MTTNEKKPRRRELIQAIRTAIAERVPATEEAVTSAIDAWRDGKDPAHPLENGIFAMCDQVARDLDAIPDPGGDK